MPRAGSATARGYGPAHERLRLDVWRAGRGVCAYCGRAITLDEMDADHVVPVAYDRPNVRRVPRVSDYVCACRGCNRSRGARLGNVRRSGKRYRPSRAWV